MFAFRCLSKRASPAVLASRNSFNRLPAIRGDRYFRISSSLNDTLSVFVDGEEVEIPQGSTVLQACEYAEKAIPRFCYHEKLAIAGNCRMCLVEVEKSPKPVASCAMPAMPGMKIKTDTPLVKRAREGVMEFLLINHPLDCPICDQGGECDLQDQSMAFGRDNTAFRDIKRGVEDKDIGPLIETVMTRCIHCTRCVRFTTDVAGITDMGVTGRGNQAEIGTYVDKVVDSELSGNVIDLCPVGALTSKPYAMKARPWELETHESVDVMDAVGSNIKLNTRGAEVLRVIPRMNEEINEEWISDKTRFAYDGLKRQRLDTPLIRKGDKFEPVTWVEALTNIGLAIEGVKPEEMQAIAGDTADCESLVVLKDLFNKLGCENLTSTKSIPISADIRSDYLFNSSIAGIEDADVVLLVGTNPRMEAPIVCHRIRKAVKDSGTVVANIGPAANLALPTEELGNSASVLEEIASGKHAFSKTLKNAERPLVIVGKSALQREDGLSVMDSVKKLSSFAPNLLTEEWNGLNVLHTAASDAAVLDLGFVQGVNATTPPKFVYLLNADDEEMVVPDDAFVVYQGHHGDVGAMQADVILPGVAYTEKNATYVNMEGRPQTTIVAVPPVGEAREDWKILAALGEVLDAGLQFKSHQAVRQRMVEIAPHFTNLDEIEPPSYTTETATAATVDPAGFAPYFNDFFLTNPISRNSKAMLQASKELPTSTNSYLKEQIAQ